METRKYVKKEILCENNGKMIYGIACIPEGKNEELPVVIFSHGYNSSHKALLPFAEYLADKGIISYCYDFCGGSKDSKSQGNSTEMTIFTEQSDLNEVINMVSSWNYVDKDKIFLFGGSQGGLVSAITAVERNKDIFAVMLLFPALCIPDDGRKMFKNIHEIPQEVDCMGMKLGKIFYESIFNYDVYEHIRKLNKNVLIFHGSSDTLVDMTYSQKALQVLQSAELKIFDGEGHGFSNEGNKKVAEMSYEFVKKMTRL